MNISLRLLVVLISILSIAGCTSLITKAILSDTIAEKGVEGFPYILTEEELQLIKEKNAETYKSDPKLFKRYVLAHNMFKNFEESIRTFPRDKEYSPPKYHSWGPNHIRSNTKSSMSFALSVWDWNDSRGVIPQEHKLYGGSPVMSTVLRQRYAIHDEEYRPTPKAYSYLIGDLGTVLTIQAVDPMYNDYIDRLEVTFSRLNYEPLSYEGIINPFPDSKKYARAAYNEMSKIRRWKAKETQRAQEYRNCRSKQWDASGNCVAGGRDEFDAHKAYGQWMAGNLMTQMQSDIDSKQAIVKQQQQQIQQNQQNYNQAQAEARSQRLQDYQEAQQEQQQPKNQLENLILGSWYDDGAWDTCFVLMEGGQLRWNQQTKVDFRQSSNDVSWNQTALSGSWQLNGNTLGISASGTWIRHGLDESFPKSVTKSYSVSDNGQIGHLSKMSCPL